MRTKYYGTVKYVNYSVHIRAYEKHTTGISLQLYSL
jgi:hypothetical protein